MNRSGAVLPAAAGVGDGDRLGGGDGAAHAGIQGEHKVRGALDELAAGGGGAPAGGGGAAERVVQVAGGEVGVHQVLLLVAVEVVVVGLAEGRVAVRQAVVGAAHHALPCRVSKVSHDTCAKPAAQRPTAGMTDRGATCCALLFPALTGRASVLAAGELRRMHRP